MHAVFGLKQLGLTFELKGGTSLSKGFGIIQRFSEDIDIRIEPFDGLQADTNPNHEKPQHIESRRQFYEKLRDKIKIPGITTVERDTTYDDATLRNAGLRLAYETHFGSIAGLKDGILLEVGFDQTTPNRAVTISSWIVQFAEAKKPVGSSYDELLANVQADLLVLEKEYDQLIEAFESVLPGAQKGGFAAIVLSGRAPLPEKIMHSGDQTFVFVHSVDRACQATIAADMIVYPKGLEWLPKANWKGTEQH